MYRKDTEAMGLFSKLFGTNSEREVKTLNPVIDKIEALGEKYHAMSDKELQAQTGLLKERLAHGETLDDILPEAFATCREAADRVLGMRPYRVQLIGGMILHQGRIAEMKTGDGKTLVATLPAYLNALSGRGVHIITVNDYLAKRDSEWMGKLYRFLGLTVGLVIHGVDKEEKKRAYAADITYGTNSEFGFDYLRDNMVTRGASRVQRGHHFAIVDEVDSILIDEARTPLIISGQGDKSTDIYKVANQAVTGMDLDLLVSNHIRGEEGSKVKIVVLRGDANEEVELNIERRQIEVPTVEHEMLENQIGYIYVMQFDDVTSQQFRAAVDDLESQGMEKLVIDLRDNPGGVLDGVVEMLAYVLPEDKLDGIL